MIRHMVLFKLKSGIGEEEKQKIIRLFKHLGKIVPGIKEVDAGENSTEETDYIHGFDFGLCMLLESRKALRQYLLHEEHLKVSKQVMQLIQEVIVLDLEIGQET